jgi:acetyl esterase/lipase
LLNLTIPINPLGSAEPQAKLATYVLDGERQRPAVLICPGGAYRFISPREAEAVAMQFCAAGFHTFILTYTVVPPHYRSPLLELSQAVCEIRKKAEDWKVDPERIAVCGFSAGGHLAASLGVHWHRLDDAPQNKPNALILSYPVITSGEFKHPGSIENLLGPNPSPELLEEMCLEKQVNSNTPPTFLWHTVEDQVVPVENSMMFASALRQNNIPFELHIYPHGPHGLSLATLETDDGRGVNPQAATWMGLCISWLKELFQFE